MSAETTGQKANRNKWLLIVSIVLTGFIVLAGFIIIVMLLTTYLQKEQTLSVERTKSHLLKQKIVPAMSTDTQKIVSMITPVNEGDLQATAKPKPMSDVIAEIPSVMLNNEPTAQEKKQALTAALAEYNSQMQNVAVVDKVIVVPDITASTNKNKTPHDKPRKIPIEKTDNAARALTKKPATALNRSRHIKHVTLLDKKLLNANKQAYTIQLLGSHKEQAIRNFINTHKITSQVNYFKTQLNGKNWYVLVYGHYSSKDKALTAIAKLPNTLRQLQPWPRRFADIK